MEDVDYELCRFNFRRPVRQMLSRAGDLSERSALRTSLGSTSHFVLLAETSNTSVIQMPATQMNVCLKMSRNAFSLIDPSAFALKPAAWLSDSGTHVFSAAFTSASKLATHYTASLTAQWTLCSLYAIENLIMNCSILMALHRIHGYQSSFFAGRVVCLSVHPGKMHRSAGQDHQQNVAPSRTASPESTQQQACID
jgi:hypothetical protein